MEIPEWQCPFCCSKISAIVKVCPQCGRDVLRIYELTQRVKYLEQFAPEAEPKPPNVKRYPLYYFVIGYFVIGMLILKTFIWQQSDSYDMPFFLSLTYAVAFLTGVISIRYCNTKNLWMLALLGFVQFPIVAHLFDPANPLVLDLHFRISYPTVTTSLFLFIGGLAGGVATTISFKELFDYKPLTEFYKGVTVRTEMADSIVKSALKIGTAITTYYLYFK